MDLLFISNLYLSLVASSRKDSWNNDNTVHTFFYPFPPGNGHFLSFTWLVTTVYRTRVIFRANWLDYRRQTTATVRNKTPNVSTTPSVRHTVTRRFQLIGSATAPSSDSLFRLGVRIPSERIQLNKWIKRTTIEMRVTRNGIQQRKRGEKSMGAIPWRTERAHSSPIIIGRRG